jgi:peptidoglycan/LPS O-acetylase OafA/YrhL
MQRWLLLIMLLFQGLSGLAGGVGLIGDPTGESLQIPIEWLAGSPFADYLVPGIVLFTVLGIFPLIAAWGVWKRKSWGRTSALLVGGGLCIWILVEVIVIGYQPEPPLQAIYGAVAVIILFLALSTSGSSKS